MSRLIIYANYFLPELITITFNSSVFHTILFQPTRNGASRVLLFFLSPSGQDVAVTAVCGSPHAHTYTYSIGKGNWKLHHAFPLIPLNFVSLCVFCTNMSQLPQYFQLAAGIINQNSDNFLLTAQGDHLSQTTRRRFSWVLSKTTDTNRYWSTCKYRFCVLHLAHVFVQVLVFQAAVKCQC